MRSPDTGESRRSDQGLAAAGRLNATTTIPSHYPINWDAVGAGIETISGKWMLPVMAALTDGPKRHNELSRAVKIDHKRLGRVLRQAQQAQIVTRYADASTEQARVRYQLTRYGKDLLPILAELGSWIQSTAPT